MLYHVSIDGRVHRVEIKRADDSWFCRVDAREFSVNVQALDDQVLSLLIAGESYEVRRATESTIFIRERHYEVSVEDPRSWRAKRRSDATGEGPQKLTSSMPGKIVRVLASEGEKIEPGQGIAVVEAMKMQNEIKSPKAGTLKKLFAHPGMNVNAGEVLAIVE